MSLGIDEDVVYVKCESVFILGLGFMGSLSSIVPSLSVRIVDIEL